MARDNLTRGGTGSVRGDTGSDPTDDAEDTTSEPAETETADDESPPENIQNEGGSGGFDNGSDSTTDDSSSPSDTRTGGRVPNDIQNEGGSGGFDDDDDGTSTRDDTGGADGGDTTTGGQTPSDVQDAGPGPADSPEGGEQMPDETDTGSDADTQPDGPPSDVQRDGPGAGSESSPDFRAGPGRSQTGTLDDGQPDDDADDDADVQPDDGEGSIDSAIEQRVVDARDYLDGNDVVTVVEDGVEQVRLTASGAAAKFAASRDGVDESDVVATNSADGGFDIEFTDAFREEQIEEGFERGPTGAGETLAEEAGITDAGSPNDPLEGTGLEAGLGQTADRAREIEESVADQIGADPDEIEVVERDGQFVVVDSQPSVPDEVGQPDPPAENRLRRQTTGRTPDTTTAAANELVDRVEAELDERGIDREDVTIDTTVEDGQVRAEVEPREEEQFGDFAIRLPTSQDQDNFAETAFESAVGAAFGPIGATAGEVSGVAADLAGVGGERSEDVLGTASDRINRGIAAAAPVGGDLIEDAVASGALGPGVTRTTASSVADVGLAAADEATGDVASEVVDEYTEGAFVGAASLADIPGTVVGVKEGGEFVVEGVEETAAGRGGEFKSEASEAAKTAAMNFARYADQNRAEALGTVSGALAASTVSMGTAGALSSRAGTVTRFAVQPGEELLTAATGRTASGVARGVSTDVKTRFSNSDFLGDTRGQAQIPVSRDVEADSDSLEFEQPDGSSVDSSDVSNFEPDRGTVLEGSPRDRLSDDVSGRAVSETQAADSDFELSPRQLREGSRQDMATFDPDQVPRSQGGETTTRKADSPGQDFSGFLRRERRLREEFGTEEPSVSAEIDTTPRFGTGGEAAVRAVETNALTGLEMAQEVDQEQAAESPLQRPRNEFDVESGSEVEIEEETDLFEDVNLDSRVEEQQAIDVRQEQTTTERIDTEQRQEQRQESRTEIESRFESESESETRLDFALEPNEDDEENPFAGTSVEDEVFDTGVVQDLNEF